MLGQRYWYKIGAAIVNNTDNILISAMISTAMVGLYSNYQMVVVLLLAIILTYQGGILIERNDRYYWLFFVANISILLFYIYTGFVIVNIIRIIGIWGMETEFVMEGFTLVTPLGLSFYIFQSTTYLGDVRKNRLKPVKNFLKYAAFASFFPTITSGPKADFMGIF